MEKSTELLLIKMNEDKEFAEKILTQKENKKVIEIAKAEGIELTNENIIEANEALRAALTNKDGELSEEELESVAGGTMSLALVASAAVGVSVTASLVGTAVSGATLGAAATLACISVDELLLDKD